MVTPRVDWEARGKRIRKLEAEIKKLKGLGGAPTRYKERYCEDIITFFDVEHMQTIVKTKTTKDGEIVTWEETVPNKIPMFERFAFNCGVDTDTLRKWTKAHPEFGGPYKIAKELQKEMVNSLAVAGYLNPTYTQFFAKNCLGMKDKVEQEINTNSTVKTVYIEAEEKNEYEKHIEESVMITIEGDAIEGELCENVEKSEPA